MPQGVIHIALYYLFPYWKLLKLGTDAESSRQYISVISSLVPFLLIVIMRKSKELSIP